jgi:hypothetical protein
VMRRLRAQVDGLGRQESDGFHKPESPGLFDVLNLVQYCSFCCSWSASVLELKLLPLL